MSEKSVLIAVARADVILTALARDLLLVALLLIVLLGAVLIVRARADPYRIDYDKPGTDITSEGPDTYTANWFIWECEEKGENRPTEHGPKGRQYKHQ